MTMCFEDKLWKGLKSENKINYLRLPGELPGNLLKTINESKYHFLYFLDICEVSKTYITQIPKKANSLNAITKKYRNVNTYYNLAQRIS